MSRVEPIVNAFFMLCKTGKTVFLPQRFKAAVATGKDFMSVTLMAHIPNQSVARTVEHLVQGDRQFHNAQIARKMSARLSDYPYNALPYFVG